MKNEIIIFLILFALGFSGCTNQAPQPTPATATYLPTVKSPSLAPSNTPAIFESTIFTVTPTSSPIPRPTSTPTPSPTPFPPVSTQVKTVTVEPMTTAEVLGSESFPAVEHQCIRVSDTLPLVANELNGVVVLVNESLQNEQDFLLDLKTGTKIFLSYFGKQAIDDFSVSPDYNRLAYIASNLYARDQTILITDVDGRTIATYDLNPPLEGGGRIQQWFDNDRLWITFGKGKAPDAYTMILNPFTGENNIIQSDFPKIYNALPSFWGSFNQSRAIFNPTFNMVLYPSDGRIILLDLSNSQIAMSIPDRIGGIGSQPVWSPDGSQFVIDIDSANFSSSPKNEGRNIYLISLDGQIVKYTSINNPDNDNFVDYSWSPDGKFIAFWLKVGEVDIEKVIYNLYDLAILDINRRQVTDYCIPAYNSGLFPINPPVWSPDGHYLVVASRSNPTLDHPQAAAILVDPFNHWAYSIAQNFVPAGWMSKGK